MQPRRGEDPEENEAEGDEDGAESFREHGP